MIGWFQRFAGRVARARRRFFWRRKLWLYLADLPVRGEVRAARRPVDFRVNCPEGFRVLQAGAPEYGLEAPEVAQIPGQIERGEVCFTGWVDGTLVFYCWVVFGTRKLARHTKVRLSPTTAFIYRGFTREDSRGLGIYAAGLRFMFAWLAERGYRRVFGDVMEDNTPSRRGLETAGMRPVVAFWTWRGLWIRRAILRRRLRRLLAEESSGIPVAQVPSGARQDGG